MASSLARPPALRMTWASPSDNPAYFAGSRRASMHVRIAKPRAGGSARSFLAPKSEEYLLLAAMTSSTILLMRDLGFCSWLDEVGTLYWGRRVFNFQITRLL